MVTSYHWSNNFFHQFFSFIKIALLHGTTPNICIHSKGFLLMYKVYTLVKQKSTLSRCSFKINSNKVVTCSYFFKHNNNRNLSQGVRGLNVSLVDKGELVYIFVSLIFLHFYFLLNIILIKLQHLNCFRESKKKRNSHKNQKNSTGLNHPSPRLRTLILTRITQSSWQQHSLLLFLMTTYPNDP